MSNYIKRQTAIDATTKFSTRMADLESLRINQNLNLGFLPNNEPRGLLVQKDQIDQLFATGANALILFFGQKPTKEQCIVVKPAAYNPKTNEFTPEKYSEVLEADGKLKTSNYLMAGPVCCPPPGGTGDPGNPGILAILKITENEVTDDDCVSILLK